MPEPDQDSGLVALCRRLVSDSEAAALAVASAETAGSDPTVRIRAALEACRSIESDAAPEADGEGLAAAVTAELQAATAGLDAREREVLALREVLGLDHAGIAAALELDPEAVAQLLADARISLRAELRGKPTPAGSCPNRERTLGTATRRQDSEPVSAEDEDWLFAHLGSCPDCVRAHAVLLEGGTSYRSWPA
jgi:hypothetical protein